MAINSWIFLKYYILLFKYSRVKIFMLFFQLEIVQLYFKNQNSVKFCVFLNTRNKKLSSDLFLLGFWNEKNAENFGKKNRFLKI